MPEFILPDEADHCPHCGALLHDPPDCCSQMRAEFDMAFPNRFSPAESTEAEIRDALDFGKTAEQHLRGGTCPD